MKIHVQQFDNWHFTARKGSFYHDNRCWSMTHVQYTVYIHVFLLLFNTPLAYLFWCDVVKELLVIDVWAFKMGYWNKANDQVLCFYFVQGTNILLYHTCNNCIVWCWLIWKQKQSYTYNEKSKKECHGNLLVLYLLEVLLIRYYRIMTHWKHNCKI